MVIDSHVHITAPKILASMDELRRKEPYFNLLCGSPKNRNVTAEELIFEMDRTGVDKSVVFGFGYKDNDICKISNDYTIEAVTRFPDRLIGFAVINPGSDDAIPELERCKGSGLRGAGEIMPMGQNLDITDGRVMGDICGFCTDAGWPLLVHVNEIVGHKYPGKTDDSIREAETLALAFPDTIIIFAHLGGGLCFYETMPEVRKSLVNVYYDTAAMPFLYDETVFDGLKQIGVLQKIIFGTDYPLLNAEVYRRRIESSSLSGPEKEAFFGGTIAGILRLGAETDKKGENSG